MYEFDTHSVLEDAGGHRYETVLTDLWNVGPVPNGGYLVGLAAKAMAQACGHPDPLSVTGHYLRPAQPGPASLVVTPFKQGGTFDHAQVSIIQDGTERCRFFGAYGTLERISGPTWMDGEPPVLPPPEDCEPLRGSLSINARHDARFDPSTIGWLRGEQGENAEFRLWLCHADGRPNDPLSLLMYADAMPPPIFNRLGPSGWVPTVELTVHVRARPAPGYIRCRFRTRYVTNGLLEADGELWDGTGALVALSRQLARLR